jgi:exodeoxyribonuclease VII large subunit
LRNRRDRFAGLEVRLKASKIPTPRRSARHRARPRAHNGWPNAPPCAGHGDAAAQAVSPIAGSYWRRCPIAACRARSFWCARRGSRRAWCRLGRAGAHLSIEFADGRVGATAVPIGRPRRRPPHQARPRLSRET